jgi:hypothetical protein
MLLEHRRDPEVAKGNYLGDVAHHFVLSLAQPAWTIRGS